MKIDKKKWFDVPDSLTKREDEKGEYYNVEARFSDHPVINVEKSKRARHNVYEWSIVLHTRVKKAVGDVPAVENMSAQPLRFDKGTETVGEDGEVKPGLRREDFEAAKACIVRCWDAWEYYQQWREAPVTHTERAALKQIDEAPAPGRIMVDVGGELQERRMDGTLPDDDSEDEGETPAPPPARVRTRRRTVN